MSQINLRKLQLPYMYTLHTYVCGRQLLKQGLDWDEVVLSKRLCSYTAILVSDAV